MNEKSKDKEYVRKMFLANLALQNFDLMTKMESVIFVIKELHKEFSKDRIGRDKLRQVLIKKTEKLNPLFLGFDQRKISCLNDAPVVVAILFPERLDEFILHKDAQTDEQSIENSIHVIRKLSEEVKSLGENTKKDAETNNDENNNL